MRYGQLKVAVLGSVLGLFAACAPRSAVEQQAKEIAELKRQLGELQGMIDVKAYTDLTNKVAASQMEMLGNFQKFSNSNVKAWNTVAALERRTAALEVAQTNSSHTTQAALSTSKNKAITAAAPAEAMKDGIPLSVWNQIFQKEKEKWPGNYTMQQLQMELQVKAYKELHR